MRRVSRRPQSFHSCQRGDDLRRRARRFGSQSGHTIHRSSGVVLEVVRVVDADEDDPDHLRGYLVVRVGDTQI
jgi:hypothetical protein